MNSLPCHRGPGWRAAFTLVETLVVMTILVVLFALVASAVRSFREDMHLTQAGQLVVDQIGAARQAASAHNWTVYVYFYKAPNSASAGYSALQLWRCAPPEPGAAMRMLPVDQAYFLPSTMVISEEKTRQSALLGMLDTPAGNPPPLDSLPPTLAGAEYVAFAIKPSGMLALNGKNSVPPKTGAAGVPPSAASVLAACCLTVVPARFGRQAASPANFVTVQINPYTGTLLVYRP